MFPSLWQSKLSSQSGCTSAVRYIASSLPYVSGLPQSCLFHLYNLHSFSTVFFLHWRYLISIDRRGGPSAAKEAVKLAEEFFLSGFFTIWATWEAPEQSGQGWTRRLAGGWSKSRDNSSVTATGNEWAGCMFGLRPCKWEAWISQHGLS